MLFGGFGAQEASRGSDSVQLSAQTEPTDLVRVIFVYFVCMVSNFARFLLDLRCFCVEMTPNASNFFLEHFLSKSGPPSASERARSTIWQFQMVFRSTDARATYAFLPRSVIRMLKHHYHMQEGSAADGGAVKDGENREKGAGAAPSPSLTL